MTLEPPQPPGNINVDLVNRIAAVLDRIAFVNDKEGRQFERAVRRAATLAEYLRRRRRNDGPATDAPAATRAQLSVGTAEAGNRAWATGKK